MSPAAAIPIAGDKVLICGNHNRKGAVGTITGVHNSMLTVHLDASVWAGSFTYISCRPDQVKVLGTEELGGEG